MVALSVEDQKVGVSGRETDRKSTAGCDTRLKWKDGSISRERISNIKVSHPMQFGKYAVD